jgi:hypothetical protein
VGSPSVGSASEVKKSAVQAKKEKKKARAMWVANIGIQGERDTR